METLNSYPPDEVALARKRVALGAAFFNERFPGWQEDILAESSRLYMESMDYCAVAIAAKRRVAPSGRMMFSHGDVCREYPDFDSSAMGCSIGRSQSEVLKLCWIEAAQMVPPKLIARTWWQRFKDHMRQAQAYGAELAY